MTLPADIVVPTVGRRSLAALLAGVAAGRGPVPGRIVIVDDRATPVPPLDLSTLGPLRRRAEVVVSGGRGPAAARNAGLGRCRARWVAFLDDDVVPQGDWRADLDADLSRCGPGVAACQGRLAVPLPSARRPTDLERGVAGLEGAPFLTADMAYRREVLEELGGFDERFPRAYREDTDLALRTLRAGWTIAWGDRLVHHPVRPAGFLASLRAQRGNADDMLMIRLHGPRCGWGERRQGRRGRHVVQTAVLLAATALAPARPRVAAVLAVAWTAGWARFTWGRVAPGPRTPREVLTMALTSALIPPVATWHAARGGVRARRLVRTAFRTRGPGYLPPSHRAEVTP